MFINTGSIHEMRRIWAKFIIIQCVVIGFQHKFDTVSFHVVFGFVVIRNAAGSCYKYKWHMFTDQHRQPTAERKIKSQIHCHLHPLIVTYQANHIFRKCNLRIDQRRCPNMNTGLIKYCYCYRMQLVSLKCTVLESMSKTRNPAIDKKKCPLLIGWMAEKWFVIMIFSSANPFFR